ncbi:MAG: hypothetical protein R2729_10310 [Bryobacteraceae bacterium]
MRISTVVVSAGQETKVYHSIGEVPTNLRERVIAATNGDDSMTLLIADEAGRRELMRSAGGHPAQVSSKLIDSMTAGMGASREAARWRQRQWAEVALVAGIGVCLWLLARWA